jgi:hypothetical protein
VENLSKITAGTREQFSSGLVHSIGFEPIVLYLPDKSYRIEIIYDVNAALGPLSITATVSPDKLGTVVKLTNFESGGATVDPLWVATQGGRKVLLQLLSHSFGQHPRLVRQTAFSLSWGDAV